MPVKSADADAVSLIGFIGIMPCANVRRLAVGIVVEYLCDHVDYGVGTFQDVVCLQTLDGGCGPMVQVFPAIQVKGLKREG